MTWQPKGGRPARTRWQGRAQDEQAEHLQDAERERARRARSLCGVLIDQLPPTIGSRPFDVICEEPNPCPWHG